MAEHMTLQVDTGAVTIDLTDKNGKKIGEFDFNPSDSNIFKRYENVVDFFNSVSFSENVGDDKKIEEVNKLAEDIGKQFDYLFGYSVADGMFSSCGALTVTANGDFFFEAVLEGVANLIEKVTKQRINKKLAKVRKATAKYQK